MVDGLWAMLLQQFMNIREANKSDAEALLDLFSKLDSESDFMLLEPDERQTTISEQEAIIDSFSKISNRLMLIADSGEVDGVCILAGNQQRRNSHVASLVMGVSKSKWNQSIASRLLETAISRAEGIGINHLLGEGSEVRLIESTVPHISRLVENIAVRVVLIFNIIQRFSALLLCSRHLVISTARWLNHYPYVCIFWV